MGRAMVDLDRVQKRRLVRAVLIVVVVMIGRGCVGD